MAIDTFGARGYAATSIAELLQSAGLGAATLYHHFGEKSGLYIAAANAGHERVLGEVHHQAREAHTGAQRLQAVLRAGNALVDSEPGLLPLVVAVASEARRHPILKPATTGLEAFLRFIHDAAHQGCDDGSLNAGATPQAHADLFMTIIAGLSAVTTTMSATEYRRRAENIDAMYDSGGPLAPP